MILRSSFFLALGLFFSFNFYYWYAVLIKFYWPHIPLVQTTSVTEYELRWYHMRTQDDKHKIIERSQQI